MSHVLVQLKQLNLQLNQQVILRDISLELQRGEIVTLIGPNGSGKSSLVKVVVGLLKASSGSRVLAPKLTYRLYATSLKIR
jgi:zinc transport system ATP-binding protein